MTTYARDRFSTDIVHKVLLALLAFEDNFCVVGLVWRMVTLVNFTLDNDVKIFL